MLEKEEDRDRVRVFVLSPPRVSEAARSGRHMTEPMPSVRAAAGAAWVNRSSALKLTKLSRSSAAVR